MTEEDARSKMGALFVSYQSFLNQKRLKWLINGNKAIAVRIVLPAVCPIFLQFCLRSDLSLTHRRMENDFKRFMAHAIKLSKAFILVKNGSSGRTNVGTSS